MRRRHWLYFIPAAAIVLTAVAVRLAAGGSDLNDPAAAPPPSSSTSSTSTSVVTTDTTAPEAPAEPEDAAPVDLDLTKVDRQNPREVAIAWGCAYWAHPRSETPEALAQRLAPLATAEMTAAVEQLRIPDYGTDVVEVYPGVAERTETPNTYSVGCSTLTTGPDGAPTAPPAAVFPEVTMTIEGPGWVVSGAVVGGLVLP